MCNKGKGRPVAMSGVLLQHSFSRVRLCQRSNEANVDLGSVINAASGACGTVEL